VKRAVVILSVLLGVSAQAQVTFCPQVQSTPSASIIYDPGKGIFQFTNIANLSEDNAHLPLCGTAAALITPWNNWTASLAVSISARQMTLSGGSSSQVVMGLALGTTIPNTGVFVFAAQDNNTGGGDDAIYPHGWYGTAIRFGSVTNGTSAPVTPLGSSLPSSNGSVYLQLSGATNGSPGTVPCSNVTGVVTLCYDAPTATATGYFNGTPIGSCSLAGWGADPPLSLAVWGGSGKVAVPAGTDMASNFFAGTLPASAKAPPWQWARHVASTTNQDNELTIGLALDSAANVYVTGWFDGTNDFGNGIRLTNSPGGGQDIFVAKYDSSGVSQWARRAGSVAPPGPDPHDLGRDAGRGIGVDDAGNVYVTGGFFSNADFGPFSVSAPTNREFFLAKYDRFGTVQWVRQSMGGNGTSGPGWSDGAYGTGLAVDGGGNCYAVGFAANVTAGRAPVTFGTTSLFNTNTGGGSTFIVKYDSNGVVQWATALNSPNESYATSVSLDSSGNVYVAGTFRTAVNIGATNFTAAGTGDGFAAKFSGAGVLQWARQMAANSRAGEGSIYADASGWVYVAGDFGTAAGDTVSFGPTITLTNIGGGLGGTGIGDAFLAKFDGATGTAQWARRAGGTNADAYIAGPADPQGNVYVGGATGGIGVPAGFKAWVVKYNSNGGVQWEQFSAGTNGTVVFAGPRVDTGGNCYVAGWFQTNAVFGNTTLTGQGAWDFFLAKLGRTPLTLGIAWSNTLPWLSVSGDISNRFALEYVPALPASNNWQSLSTNTITSNPFLVPDSSVVGSSRRYYRARLVP
jgi:hypothetical protein